MHVGKINLHTEPSILQHSLHTTHSLNFSHFPCFKNIPSQEKQVASSFRCWSAPRFSMSSSPHELFFKIKDSEKEL